MKKAILIILVLCGNFSIVAQSDTKIKGDRNVTIKQTYIDDFNALVINGDFPVEVIYNSKPSVEIEADDNLHDVIDFQVNNGVLTFTETMKITSKKKLQIRINYGDNLSHIEANADSEIRSLTSMELGDVTLKTDNDSRVYLNINARNFKYEGFGKSKIRLNLNADSTDIQLNDNTKFDGLIVSKSSKFNLYQRADALVEGSTDQMSIITDNSSKFNGSKFKAKSASISALINSDIYTNISDYLAVEISGNSEVYLYGTPKIDLNKFIDTAKLQKKE